MNLFLIRSDDINMLGPTRDFPCQGFTSFLGFNLCGLEIVDAETVNVVVETFPLAQGHHRTWLDSTMSTSGGALILISKAFDYATWRRPL